MSLGEILFIPGLGGGAGPTPPSLLLDTYTAAVGFSLRKLRTAYSGNCIRVRRASDNAEQDIGFSSNLVDTAAINTFCSGTDGFVTTWYDQVGSNNAVQATTTLQPVIYTSGAVLVNEHGNPAMRLEDSSGVAIGVFLEMNPWYTASQSYVGYFTIYSLSTTGSFASIINSDPNGRGFVSIHNGVTGEFRAATFRGVTTAANGSVVTLNQTTARYDAADRTTLQTFIDKVATADINVADSNTDFLLPTKARIGTGNTALPLYDYLISEHIGFTVDQSANNLAIRTNQYDYWSA